MKLKKLPMTLGALMTVSVVGILVFNQPLKVGYHTWRMHADFNQVFGDPQSHGGLTSFDVSDIDVDQVLASYASHRDTLVSLGAFSHLTGSFPLLVSDGTIESSEKREEFAERMWKKFPAYRFYHLKEDGSFSVWVPKEDEEQWQAFLDSEIEPVP